MKTTPPRVLWATLIAILMLCAIAPSPAHSYGIRYDHYVYATGSANPPIQGSGNLIGLDMLTGHYSHEGEPLADNHATVDYSANLHTGSVESHAYATGAVTGFWPYGFTATGRNDAIAFEVYLDFKVPPGTYPDGVTVGVRGTVYGTMVATENAQAKLEYNVDFGTASHLSGLLLIAVESNDANHFTDPFSLDHKIVNDGVVLPDTAIYSVRLVTGISNSDASTTRSGTSPNYSFGSAQVDCAIQLTSVAHPAFVDWTTEDDVFFDEPVGVVDTPTATRTWRLEQNVPNPFNPSTTIRYFLAEPVNSTLVVYDVTGRRVRELAGPAVRSGPQRAVWDGRNDHGRRVASGVYFCRLTAGAGIATRRMVLLK